MVAESDNSPEVEQIPRFLQAVQVVEGQLTDFAASIADKDDSERAALIEDVMQSTSSISGLAQRVEFTSSVETLVGTSAQTAAARRLAEAVASKEDDSPAVQGIKEIYQRLYAPEIASVEPQQGEEI